MGTETHELQYLIVRYAVDEYQVGFNMAVAVIFPFTRKCMIAKTLWQRFIVSQFP